jgi:uncharacterized protein (TIGR00730 family)
VLLQTKGMPPKSVCVYCASSRQANPAYANAAHDLGQTLARAGTELVYGGGTAGSMGALARGALEAGGRVVGVIPRFMEEMEVFNHGVTELIVVDNMHARKLRMLQGTDAVVALPGGAGTLEELFEAISWKRLGLYTKPIVLVNTLGFFDHCTALLDRCVEEKFLADRHRDMWTVVSDPSRVIAAIADAQPWEESTRLWAVL